MEPSQGGGVRGRGSWRGGSWVPSATLKTHLVSLWSLPCHLDPLYARLSPGAPQALPTWLARPGREWTLSDDHLLSHSALHTAGVRNVLCGLLGGPSA